MVHLWAIVTQRRFQNRRGPRLEEVPQLDVRVLKRIELFDLSVSSGSF